MCKTGIFPLEHMPRKEDDDERMKQGTLGNPEKTRLALLAGMHRRGLLHSTPTPSSLSISPVQYT